MSITNAVYAARQYHMRNATIDATDLRRWSQTIFESLEKENIHFIDFLRKPLEEFPSMRARKEFLTKLSDLSLNSYASWFDTYLKNIPEQNDVIDDGLRHSMETAKLHIDKLMDLYKRSLVDLFHYDALMAKKLLVLERKQSDLLRLYELDDKTEEARTLQQSILDYLHTLYESNKIENDYSSFCIAYARVMAIRAILVPIKNLEDEMSKSVCGICMGGKIGMALIPCGHVCCMECGKKQQSQCYVCRTTIQDKVKLYF
jgi:hypothetical protein